MFKRYSEEYRIISKSKLFDRKWYLKTYPDVASSGMDPLKHYINFGWKENRLPYKDFATEYTTFNICPLLYMAILKLNKKQKSKNNQFDNMVLPKNTDYDLFVSLGASCWSSVHLKAVGVQSKTLPFDWSSHECYLARLPCKPSMDIYLLNVVNLMVNHFKDFINIEDFIETENASNNRGCINIKTGLHYIHDFIKQEPFEKGFEQFYERYNRRVNRLINSIQDSQRIALVWIQDVWDQMQYSEKIVTFLTQETLRFARRQLTEKFKDKHFDFIVFNNDNSLAEDVINTKIIDDNIYIYTSNHNFVAKYFYIRKYDKYITKSIYNVLSKFTKRG